MRCHAVPWKFTDISEEQSCLHLTTHTVTEDGVFQRSTNNNGSVLHLGGNWFELWPWHRLSWVTVSVVFLNPSKHILE
jgi:hypothetical protein